MTLQEALDYYANTLIVQYRTLPKATQTIECLANCAYCDNLPLEFLNAFDLDTASGNQLTILGKIVGVPRNIYGLDLTHEFYNFTRWTTVPASNGFARWGALNSTYLFSRWRTSATYVTTDFELRALIQLRIVYNNYFKSMGFIKPALYEIFNGGIDIYDYASGTGISASNVLVLSPVLGSSNTSVTDTSPTPHTITLTNAVVTTAWQKLSSASILFNGTNAYGSALDSIDWSFGTGDLTIQGYFKFNSVSGTQIIAAQYVDINNFWQVELVGGKLQMIFVVGGVTKGSYVMTSSAGLTVGTEYHFAFIRNGATGKISINGVFQTLTTATAFAGNDVGNIASPLYIGAQSPAGGFFNGYIGYLNIVKGTALWTSDFTPPTVTPTVQVINNVTYTFTAPYYNVGTICSYLGNILPKPMGVSLTIQDI